MSYLAIGFFCDQANSLTQWEHLSNINHMDILIPNLIDEGTRVAATVGAILL